MTAIHEHGGRSADASIKHPDGLVLVYDGDSGMQAMLLDVLKKAVGREDCALCEIVYSPVGKRGAWKQCEARLGMTVREMHRDEVPDAWNISRAELPCVLARTGDERPFVLVSKNEITQCHGEVDALERAIVGALDRLKGRAS